MKLVKRLWAREPVLVGALLPVLVALGIVTTDQASALEKAIEGAASVVVVVAGAFGIRTQTRSASHPLPAGYVGRHEGPLPGAGNSLAAPKGAGPSAG